MSTATLPADVTHLSPAKQALVIAASAQGYNIRQCGNHEIFILKGVSCRSRGVMITEDGTILRNGLRHDLKTSMTMADVRKHLRLK